MKRTIIFPFIFLAIVVSSFVISAPPLTMSDQYSVRFKGKGVSGFFNTLRGKINFDERNLATASFNMEIDAASITTGNSLKTWNSKRKKWFDVKTYPLITLNSSKVSKTEKGYLLNGKLKMKGVEKEVSIPFTYISNVFAGSFYVRRTDFNIGKYKGISKIVADSIRIDLTVPVNK